MKDLEMRLEIDNKEVTAKKGMTVLEVAKGVGVEIPTLCYNEALAPYGACRLCTVEISRNGDTRLVTACNYPVQEGLVVRTNSNKVRRLRKGILELLLSIAPHKTLQGLALEYGIEKPRFEEEVTFCVLCGLCVRYCAEIKKANAIGFAGRGAERRVVFFPEIASTVCMSCRECFGLCPTGKIPSETDGVCFDGLTIDDFIAG
jgi:bidirectional [NiFe] hydrogenase diaphorase subunit